MAEILVRGLEVKVVDRLKKRAKANGRSLQAEAKGILEEASLKLTMDEAREAIEKLTRQVAGRKFPDSVPLIRKMRGR